MAVTSYIDLLRHGETTEPTRYCGSTDTPLSKNGWAQMWAASNYSSPNWDHIITSPLIRCAAFAKIFGQRHMISYTVEDRIKETHFGDWENHSAAELMRVDSDALTRFWNNPMCNTPPNGECLSNFNKRVLSAWEDNVTKNTATKTLLITHGGVIRMILCHVLQYPVERMFEFKIGHATIHRIQIKHEKLRNHISLITPQSL